MALVDDDALRNIAAISDRSPQDVARLYAELLLHAHEVIEIFREGDDHDVVLCETCGRIRANVKVISGMLKVPS